MFMRAMCGALVISLLIPAFAGAAAANEKIIIGVVTAAAADAKEAATVKAGSAICKIVKDEKGRKVAAEANSQKVEIKGTIEMKDGVAWVTVISCKIVE